MLFFFLCEKHFVKNTLRNESYHNIKHVVNKWPALHCELYQIFPNVKMMSRQHQHFLN